VRVGATGILYPIPPADRDELQAAGAHTALNLFGQVIPLGVAVVAVPVLIRALGEGRFGVLALAWALIGYFTLLDFGLGRALTQAASEAIGQGDSERLREMSVVSIASMFVLGGWAASDSLRRHHGSPMTS